MSETLKTLAGLRKLLNDNPDWPPQITGYLYELATALTQAQARCAELENIYRLYQKARRGWDEEGWLAGEWMKAQEDFHAAINAAMEPH